MTTMLSKSWNSRYLPLLNVAILTLEPNFAKGLPACMFLSRRAFSSLVSFSCAERNPKENRQINKIEQGLGYTYFN